MSRKRETLGPIVERYEYTDRRGKPLFVVNRHRPKGFSVRHLCKGERRHVPYRLVELLAADGSATVFVVEGEKDVDRLRGEGLVATCNAFGAGQGKWTREHSLHLRGRDVVILTDNDRIGANHGREIAMDLQGRAKSVRLAYLPGLPAKGDVSDWLDAGHTTAELVALASATPRWRPGNVLLPDPHLREHDYGFGNIKPETSQRRDIYCLPLAPIEKLLLLMVAEFRQPPQAKLALYLGVTPRRVRQIQAQLREAGYLITEKKGRANTYRIVTGG